VGAKKTKKKITVMNIISFEMLTKFGSIPDKAGLKEKLRSSNTFGAYVKLIIFSRGNKTT
jgi:hypothetical protein